MPTQNPNARGVRAQTASLKPAERPAPKQPTPATAPPNGLPPRLQALAAQNPAAAQARFAAFQAGQLPGQQGQAPMPMPVAQPMPAPMPTPVAATKPLPTGAPFDPQASIGLRSAVGHAALPPQAATPSVTPEAPGIDSAIQSLRAQLGERAQNITGADPNGGWQTLPAIFSGGARPGAPPAGTAVADAVGQMRQQSPGNPLFSANLPPGIMQRIAMAQGGRGMPGAAGPASMAQPMPTQANPGAVNPFLALLRQRLGSYDGFGGGGLGSLAGAAGAKLY